MIVLAYRLLDLPPMIASDPTGRLIVFADTDLAELAADRLKHHGFAAIAKPCTPDDAHRLLRHNDAHHAGDDDAIHLVDTEQLAHQLADRIVQSLADQLAA